MSLKKFQICLNHENPDIIRVGLDEFTDELLRDHSGYDSFRFCGYVPTSGEQKNDQNDSHEAYDETALSTNYMGEMKGLLLQYIKSSPNLEELFILWNLTGYEYDSRLCYSHMKCLAAIIFCTQSTPTVQKLVINRILSKFSTNIIRQLISNDVLMIQSTLQLLLSICKVSKDMSQRMYYLFMTENSYFSKILSLKVDDDSLIQNLHNTISLVILIIFRVLNSSFDDELMLKQLLEDDSILMILFQSISDYSNFNIKLIMTNFINIDCKLSFLFIEQNCISDWLSIYNHHNDNDEALTTICHQFFTLLCTDVANLFSTEKTKESSLVLFFDRSYLFSQAKLISTEILQNLVAHENTFHKSVSVTYI